MGLAVVLGKREKSPVVSQNDEVALPSLEVQAGYCLAVSASHVYHMHHVRFGYGWSRALHYCCVAPTKTITLV